MAKSGHGIQMDSPPPDDRVIMELPAYYLDQLAVCLNFSTASKMRSVMGPMVSSASFIDASASLPVSAKAVSKELRLRLARKSFASLNDLTLVSAFQVDMVWSRWA